MKRVLLIDDDKDFCAILAKNLENKGYLARYINNSRHISKIQGEFRPQLVVLDLRFGAESGLELIPRLLKNDLNLRIVVLTGYASIATAIEAIKLGAVHYLTKPVSTDEILAAFERGTGDIKTPIEREVLSLSATERDHILGSLERNHNNISAAARELGLHRRTLQRKLDKLR